MAITVTCGSCRKRMVARDSLAGTYVKCSGCGKPALVPDESDELPANPSLGPAGELTEADRQLEHLRVIRLYLGWLLVVVLLVPALCWLAAAALWLAARAASAGG